MHNMEEDKIGLVNKLSTQLSNSAADSELLQTAQKLVVLLSDGLSSETISQTHKTTETERSNHNHKKLIEKELSFFNPFNEKVREPSEDSLPTNKDNLYEEQKTVGNIEKPTAVPISRPDLQSAISINDRYGYINDLFRGDATAYERSILTINNFESLKETLDWIERTLRLTYFWDEEDKVVQQFYSIVEKRFA